MLVALMSAARACRRIPTARFAPVAIAADTVLHHRTLLTVVFLGIRIAKRHILDVDSVHVTIVHSKCASGNDDCKKNSNHSP